MTPIQQLIERKKLTKALDKVVGDHIQRGLQPNGWFAEMLKPLIVRQIFGGYNWNDPLSIPPGPCGWPDCGCDVDAICDVSLLKPKKKSLLQRLRALSTHDRRVGR